MRGSAGVMALVLSQAVAGSAAVLWASPLWSEVKRGLFKLTGSLLVVLGLAAWFAADAGRVAGDDGGAWSARLSLATAALTLVWTALLFFRSPAAGRFVGFVSVGVALGSLFAFATTSRQGYWVALFQLLAGSAYLGAAFVGLMLGHWYLTDRGLPRLPIDRTTRLLLASIVVELAALLSEGFSGVAASNDLNPLLTAGALAPQIALGLLGVTALIAVMTKLTLRGERASAVQSATGFFYLAVLFAFCAEAAAKIRFLPG